MKTNWLVKPRALYSNVTPKYRERKQKDEEFQLSRCREEQASTQQSSGFTTDHHGVLYHKPAHVLHHHYSSTYDYHLHHLRLCSPTNNIRGADHASNIICDISNQHDPSYDYGTNCSYDHYAYDATHDHNHNILLCAPNDTSYVCASDAGHPDLLHPDYTDRKRSLPSPISNLHPNTYIQTPASPTTSYTTTTSTPPPNPGMARMKY